jgi:hypothetical protein
VREIARRNLSEKLLAIKKVEVIKKDLDGKADALFSEFWICAKQLPS